MAGGIFSIDGTGASNVSATSGNLTISTITSGDLLLTAADDIVLTAGVGNNIEFADGDFLNIGGMVDQTTNTISNAGSTINFADGDNDLYIEDELEVDGTIYQAGNQVCDSSGAG
ncbi:MAG: hypothetical protein ACD_66C00114G0001, partial [uncultured bacterium]